jgi:hypothetical protein
VGAEKSRFFKHHEFITDSSSFWSSAAEAAACKLKHLPANGHTRSYSPAPARILPAPARAPHLLHRLQAPLTKPDLPTRRNRPHQPAPARTHRSRTRRTRPHLEAIPKLFLVTLITSGGASKRAQEGPRLTWSLGKNERVDFDGAGGMRRLTGLAGLAGLAVLAG